MVAQFFLVSVFNLIRHSQIMCELIWSKEIVFMAAYRLSDRIYIVCVVYPLLWHYSMHEYIARAVAWKIVVRRFWDWVVMANYFHSHSTAGSGSISVIYRSDSTGVSCRSQVLYLSIFWIALTIGSYWNLRWFLKFPSLLVNLCGLPVYLAATLMLQ